MRRIGAYAAAALAALLLAAPPAEAFGLRLGPFHIRLPLPLRLHIPHRHLYMRAGPEEIGRSEGGAALLYPGVGFKTVMQDIFSPADVAPWPFGYREILTAAFARPAATRAAALCRPADGGDAGLIENLQAAIAPNSDQQRLLQKLGGALGAANAYLANACPKTIPGEATARLALMQSQIEKLTLAVDMIRPPLQDLQRSLDDEQKARFAVMIEPAADRPARSECAALPAADWPIDQIDHSVQPTAAQRTALAEVKDALDSAAKDLGDHCPAEPSPTAVARLETIEARLDASWRATLSIRVALADFETKLSAEQKSRFDTLRLAAR